MMIRNRMIFFAAAAACVLPLGNVSSARAAEAAQAMVNGKPCVPVPGGTSRMGIELWSVPGLMQGTATNADDAEKALFAAWAAGNRGAGVVFLSDIPDGSTANIPLVDSTFARLKSFGFSGIERVDYYGLSADQLKTALAKAGLSFVLSLDNISPTHLDRSIDYVLKSGQDTYIGAVAWGFGDDKTPEGVRAAAEGLNAAGKKALAAGLHLYVHNHTGEFNQITYDIHHNGHPEMTPAIEALMDQTDPRYLSFEIDIHWIIEAYRGTGNTGFHNDPETAQQEALAFVKRHADRIIMYHVKETTPGAPGGQGKLGQGITDWPAWWAAAPKVAYYIYEMDGPPQPLEYAQIAANYMQCKATP